MYRSRQLSKAFTLIELLVVVATIAILMAILIPSLASARKQAQTTVCLSNMKQLAIGTNIYTQENNYTLPFPVSTWAGPNGLMTDTGAQEKTGWFTALDGYLGTDARDNPTGGANALGRRNYRKFKDCPVSAGLSTAPTLPVASSVQTIQQWSRTIKMNTHLMRALPNTKYTMAKLGDIIEPVSHVLFADGGAPDMIPWGYNPSGDSEMAGKFSLDTTDRGQGCMMLRHAGGANVAFIDGHAATMKLKTIKFNLTSAITLDAWESEWVTKGTTTAVYGKGLAAKSMDDPSFAYGRNPNMPLVWTVPGVLFRYK